MIKLESLKQILNITEPELQKLDIEQLRDTLGTIRYMARQVEREINRRSSDRPFGNIDINLRKRKK